MTSPLTKTTQSSSPRFLSANTDHFGGLRKKHRSAEHVLTRNPESGSVTVTLDNGKEVHLDSMRHRIGTVGEMRASIGAMMEVLAPNVTLLSSGHTELDDDDPMPIHAIASVEDVSVESRNDDFYANALSNHVAIGDACGISSILSEIPASDVSTFAGAALLHALETLPASDTSSRESRNSSASQCDALTGSLSPGPTLAPDITRASSAYRVIDLLLDRQADITLRNMDGETALMVCARRGLGNAMSRVLQRNADVSAIDEYGSTALHFACAAGFMQCVHILLDERADVHARDVEGRTALHISAIYNSAKCILILLDRRAAIDPLDIAGKSPLMSALCEGHTEIANVLLDAKAFCTKMWSTNGDCAIAAACRCAHDGAVLVDRMLEIQCDPQSTNPHTKDSLLHEAVRAGNFRIVTLLLEKGSAAKITSVNAEGVTPLYVACAHGHANIVSLLLNARAEVNNVLRTPRVTSNDQGDSQHNGTARDKETVLLVASREGHATVVSELLNAKADVNVTNSDGECALVLACASGNFGAASNLVAGGSDVSHVDNSGCSPLHAACASGVYDIAALLLRAKADLTVRDNHGRTCFHEAAISGSCAIATLLFEHLADAEAKDDQDMQPMHEACSEGHAALTQLLLESMVPLNGRDVDGQRPLHKAAKNNCEDVCTILLGAKADVHAADNDGETALHEAVKYGHMEACRALVNHGADVHAKSREGESPRSWALSREYHDLVDVMDSSANESTCVLM